MKNTTAGGDGNRFGVMLALIMLVLGVAAIVSTVGLSKTVYLFSHVFRR
jgi:hypothetical protein